MHISTNLLCFLIGLVIGYLIHVFIIIRDNNKKLDNMRKLAIITDAIHDICLAHISDIKHLSCATNIDDSITPDDPEKECTVKGELLLIKRVIIKDITNMLNYKLGNLEYRRYAIQSSARLLELYADSQKPCVKKALIAMSISIRKDAYKVL